MILVECQAERFNKDSDYYWHIINFNWWLKIRLKPADRMKRIIIKLLQNHLVVARAIHHNSSAPTVLQCFSQRKEQSSLCFGLVMFCQFETRFPEFDTVFTCTAGPVFQCERLHLRFFRLQPQIGRTRQAQNTMTTSLC